jgi:hypothetical protein
MKDFVFVFFVLRRKTIWWPSHEPHAYCYFDRTPGPLYPVTTAVPFVRTSSECLPER